MTTSSTTNANEPIHKSRFIGWVQRHQLLAAYGITFLLAWGPMFAMLAGLRGRLPSPLVLVFALLVGWASAIGAVVVSAITGGRAEVRKLLGRFLIWRVGFHWYLIAFFLMALIILGGIGLHILFGGEVPFMPFSTATSVGVLVSTFLRMVIFGLLVNTEEILWMVILMHAASNATARVLNEIMPLDTALPAPFQVISPDWYNMIMFALAAVVLVIATRGRLGYRPETAAK